MTYLLAVDYGTSFTSAAVAVEGGRPQTLEIHGESRFPSYVFLDEDGNLLVGRAARNSAAAAPERFRRAPKRELGRPEPLLFGDDSLPVEDAVARVLFEVLKEARRHHGGAPPAEVRLTHPASWQGDRRMRALAAAAAQVGFQAPAFLPEPVAAAQHFADESVTPGDYVVVYDLGGGTFDTAVVQRTDEGDFRVVGQPGGRDDLGGEDFDLWLYRHLREQLAAQDNEAVEQFETADEYFRARRAFLDDVREAKETLSEAEYADVWVGEPLKRSLRVYRHEFEHLIDAAVQQSVAQLEQTIVAAGINRDQLAGVYLTGGSSRIPLVARRVEARFGRADMRENPKTVVALGAAGTIEKPRGALVCNAPPAISGTAQVGRTLSCTAGQWAPAPDEVTIQWLRGPEDGAAPGDQARWRPIPGATGRRYQLTDEDEGRRVITEAIAESGGQQQSARSKPSAAVSPKRDTTAAPPPPAGTKPAAAGTPSDSKKSIWPKVAAAVASVLVIGLIVAAATGAFDGGGGDPDPDPGPVASSDADSDGVENFEDNCEADYNPGQVDSDDDLEGDACDSTPEPEPEPGPVPSDPDYEELLSYIPASIQDTCEEEKPTGDEADALAGYSCSPSRADGLYYYMFPDAGTLEAYYDIVEVGEGEVADENCGTTDWEGESSWHYNSDPETAVGGLKCYFDDEGDAFIEWGHDDYYVDVYAWSSDTSAAGLDRLWNLFIDAGPVE